MINIGTIIIFCVVCAIYIIIVSATGVVLLNRRKVGCYNSAQTNQQTIEQVHKYWRNPRDGRNKPQDYLKRIDRSEYLLKLFKKYITPDMSILEIGCNAGRNLMYLYEHGYYNLCGVEISGKALKLFKRKSQGMAITTYNNPIEDIIKDLSEYDVIFTMATLMHLPSESDWVYAEIASRVGSYLITIENEQDTQEVRDCLGKSYPRNYKTIFEGYGLKQIEQEESAIGTSYVMRLFQK